MARLWHCVSDLPLAVDASKDRRTAVDFPNEWGDLFDLFYLEHRMSRWHGSVASESDLAFDSWSLFNCRAILEPLMGVPLDDKLNATAFHKLIDAHLPELAGYPINGNIL